MVRMKNSWISLTSFLFLMGVAGLHACGKSKKKETAGGTVQVQFVNSQLQISQMALADEVLSKRFSLASVNYEKLLGTPCSENPSCECNTQTNMCIDTVSSAGSNASIPIGQSTQTSLESLSYRLGYISLANSVTINGSEWTNPIGNWDIFNEEASATPIESPDAAYSDPKLINILDKTKLSSLASEVTYTKSNINKYNYALINWSQAIKFKATVTLSDGTKLYSKKAVSYDPPTSTGGGSKRYSSTVSDLTTGPAEEAVIWSDNGGTFFKFQSPFEITQADYDAQTSFKIAFAYDPDGLVRGLRQSGADGGTLVDATRGYEMQAPYLDMAPVVARASETIMRETYLLRSTEATNGFDVRLSLYYVKEDATKGVRAVNKAVLHTQTLEGISAANRAFENIFSITSNSDGSITLNDSNGAAVFSNFRRLSNVGDSGKISGFCRSQTNCTSGIDLAYVLISQGELDSALTAIAVTPSPTPTPTVSF